MGDFHKLFTDDGVLQFKAVDWTATHNTNDWPSCGFTSHSTQNNAISEKPISWLGMEKLNLTQQKHPFTNQKKCTMTQNKHKKTKARFSRLLRYPAWKRRGPILVSALHTFVTYLLRHLPTYLQPWNPHGGIHNTNQTHNRRRIFCTNNKQNPMHELILFVLLWAS